MYSCSRALYKAAIDGIGSRLGKTGGSLVHQMLLIVYGSISVSTPIIAVILFVVVIAWILAVKALGIQFDALTGSEDSKSPIKSKEEPEALTNV